MENNVKKIKIKISGVNLSRIYKECEKQCITLYEIERKDHKNINFLIDFSQKEKLKSIAKQQKYKYQEVQDFGINKIINFFKNHIGLVAGIAIFAMFLIFSCQFVWDIKIYGNDYVKKEQIFEVLEQNNVNVGSFSNNIDLEKLEKTILNKIDDISLCSIIKKGSTLIINVKEKLHSVEYQNFQCEQDIVANCNMQITDLVVTQGTATKKVGDSIKKGDVIVAGYFFDTNGQKIFCKANASIKAKTWITETIEFEKTKKVATPTGNIDSESYMLFFGQKFVTKTKKCQFENFKIEEHTGYMFQNNLLPIQFVCTKYIEVNYDYIEQDFEKQKQSLIENCEKNVVSKLENGQVATNVFSVISETENAFIITSYAEIDIEF